MRDSKANLENELQGLTYKPNQRAVPSDHVPSSLSIGGATFELPPLIYGQTLDILVKTSEIVM